MFFLAVIVEAMRGQTARKEGRPRLFDRINPKYPSLEKAWLYGYDNPDENIVEGCFGKSELDYQI